MGPATWDQNSRLTAPFARAAVADALEETAAEVDAAATALAVVLVAVAAAVLTEAAVVLALLADAAMVGAALVVGAAVLVEATSPLTLAPPHAASKTLAATVPTASVLVRRRTRRVMKTDMPDVPFM
ncbi:MAG TPA: hypothetical protein VGP33_05590 [Chloroflexota bacterium]|jgi:hypothetical protein|nr:hypothetical protein [Chloroflexota bacterium]